MVTTGYTDLFGRTVVSGLGVATSGQTYTLSGTATQYGVASGVASITSTAVNNFTGAVDRQTSDIDITGQVALNIIPATNLSTVGFIAKSTNSANWFAGSMMVATGGAISLRFSKLVASGLTTIATVATGLTYVANTYYNLRYSIYWSNALQTNVMSLKLWAIGATEPGGWMATSTDASFTQYTAGTQAGLYVRDEATAANNIGKWMNVVTRSNSLPMPALTDTMCADPSVTYPKQTALQSLAVAADGVMAAIDPRTTLAGLFPRVRVSKSNYGITTSVFFTPCVYDTTEFNIGTPTNLSYDPGSIYLGQGLWLLTFEIRLAEAASNAINVSLGGGPLIGQAEIHMRSNAAQSNDASVGGCGHLSSLTYVSDPVTPTAFYVQLFPVNTATTYTIQYMALSAVKISDYFT